MCRHLGPIAATLHRAPAPVARPRGVDEEQCALPAFTSPDSRSHRSAEDVDHLSRNRRKQGGNSRSRRPESIAIRLEPGCEAWRRRERVEHGAVSARDLPRIDDRLGDVPDGCSQPLRLEEVAGRRANLPDAGHPESPALEVNRVVQRLESSMLIVRRTGHREREGQIPGIEPEDLTVRVVEPQDPDIDHVTIITSYDRRCDRRGTGPGGSRQNQPMPSRDGPARETGPFPK